MKKIIKGILLKLGFEIKRVNSVDTPIGLWDKDSAFNEIYKEIIRRTLVDKTRCYMIYQLAMQAAGLPGDCVEVGVYKGGTAKLLAKAFERSGKTVHLFDTFSGMPPSDISKDTYKEGVFGDTSLESVKSFLSDCKNIRIYKGVFPSETAAVKDKTFCLVHIDADIYKSVKGSCEFFYPRLEKSGVMLFDDYGFPLCPGAKTAVDEFFAGKRERPLYLSTGQCMVVKL